MNMTTPPDGVAEFRSHLRQVIKDLERDVPHVEDAEVLSALKDMYQAHITLLAELDRQYPEAAEDAAT